MSAATAITERTLPHDLAAERALLGGVLVAPELLPYVRDIDPKALYRDAHQRIWTAILALEEAGTPLDLLTLRARLEAAGVLDEIGGRPYLFELVDGVPRASNVEAYAQLIRDLAERRTKIHAYQRLISACYDAVDEETAKAAARAETTLAELDVQSRRGFEMLDAAGQVAALMADLERDRSGPLLRLGLPAIDDVFEGVRPGEVLQLWARPGIGKTLVCCHMVISITEWLSVAGFSLEMPAAQIVRRLCRMAFGLTNHKLKTEGFNPTWYEERFRPFVLDATPGLSVAQISARVRRLITLGVPVRAILIDHLGLIGGDRSMTTYDRVSTQARELKELAKRLDVAVILLVQVNRDAGGDGSRELHLGAARDSGVIEETADYIVGLRRLDRSTTLPMHERDKFKDVIFAKVLKHRHGGPPNREFGYRIDQNSLVLREDLGINPEAADIAGIAARAGGRR